MDNARIAFVLRRISELMEVKGEIRFRVQAYEKAARIVEEGSLSLADVYSESGVKGLKEIPGIGEGIARKIEELITTGSCREYQELKASLPRGIEEFLDVPYLGPKTALLLAKELKISSVGELEKALRAQRVRRLPRMGVKQEERLLKGIALWKKGQERMPLGEALPKAKSILAALMQDPAVAQAAWAGSLRRMRETVGDFDFLACPRDMREAGAVLERFSRLPQVEAVKLKGPKKASVRMKSGVDADLRIVPAESFGAALHYFTGSKDHNIQIREMAVKLGLKVNEYGVFRGKRLLGGSAEEDIFRAVKLPYIAPEIREGNGEVEAATAGELPSLIEEKDLRGDLHVHSFLSDGRASLEELAREAAEMGYEYIAPCDHSVSLRLAKGLSVQQLRAKNRAIDILNRKLKRLRILKGAEVDILADGSLDYPDAVLAELDIVIAAVHSRFHLEEDAQTTRVCRALAHPKVNVLAHPSGRLLNEREPYAIDMKKVIQAARENGKCLELNSQPDRMDLADTWLRAAKEAGVKVAVNTDAHNLEYLREGRSFGVGLARRGWLESSDVLNSLSLDPLLKALAR